MSYYYYRKTIFLSEEARQDLDGTGCFTSLNIQFHIFTYIIYLFDFKYFQFNDHDQLFMFIKGHGHSVWNFSVSPNVGIHVLNLFDVSLVKSPGRLWLSCAASTHDAEVTKQHRRSARQPQQFKHLYRCLTFF